MKPLRIPCHDLPGLTLALAGAFIGIGIHTYWKEGSLVEPVFCFGLSMLMGYFGATELLWIEIGDRFTYRTLLQRAQDHEWADVKAVDIEHGESEAEPGELAIRLVTGKTLRVPTSYQQDICRTLSGALQSNRLDRRVRQQMEAVVIKFRCPEDCTKKRN